MGKLGVSVKNTDERNKEIIARRYQEDPQTTMKQVQFLIVCWKGKDRERARAYYDWLKGISKSEIERYLRARKQGLFLVEEVQVAVDEEMRRECRNGLRREKSRSRAKREYERLVSAAGCVSLSEFL